MTDHSNTSINADILIADYINTLHMGKVQRRIVRQGGIKETDAEHTYSMVSLYMFLRHLIEEEQPIDSNKVVAMILVHDLPEIICGDVWYRDCEGREGKAEREAEAAKKLMRPDQYALWQEYEERKTIEAITVKKIDILQAVTSIVSSNGLSWKTNYVTLEAEIAFSKWILDTDDTIGRALAELFEIARTNSMGFSE